MSRDHIVRRRTRRNPTRHGQPNDAVEPAHPEPSAEESSDDYDVGYKRPPRHSQFKKGQSGNKRGRPKGRKNFRTELMEELSDPIVVREGGKRRTISKGRAVIKSQTAKALQGDTKAAALVNTMALRWLSQEDDPVEDVNLSAEDREILKALEDRIRRKLEARESAHGEKGGKT